MKHKRAKKKVKEHMTKDVLLSLLKAGAMLTVALTAPNALKAFRPLVSAHEFDWDDYYPSSRDRCVTRLWRKGFVDMRETTQGQIVVLTDRGKKEILAYDLATLSIEKQGSWDGKWRTVFFDIPTTAPGRNAFREYLHSMGFFQMQKSVYVHPYPCHKQIQYLREVLEIPHSVKFATVNTLENDDDLRKYFRL